jgi:D-3-phosphoglycerate dehydrogenase
VKVLVCDSISEEGLKVLRNAGHEVTVKTGMTPEDVAAVIEPYHAVIVRSATKIKKPAIEAGKNLKCIARGGIGVDNIDVEVAKAKGIPVLNTPGATTVTVAELALGMMFGLCRHLAPATASMKAGLWEKKKYEGTELFGKTLGVIGAGRIGQHVIKVAKAIPMTILGYDVVKNEEAARTIGFKYVSLDELLAKSDVITLHLPLTPETKYLINAAAIEKMKKGVLLVNCSRGGVVEEKALIAGLKSGKIAAAGIDVYEKEPTDNKELLALENVILTPHIGASTKEGQYRVGVEICEKVVETLKK